MNHQNALVKRMVEKRRRRQRRLKAREKDHGDLRRSKLRDAGYRKMSGLFQKYDNLQDDLFYEREARLGKFRKERALAHGRRKSTAGGIVRNLQQTDDRGFIRDVPRVMTRGTKANRRGRRA